MKQIVIILIIGIVGTGCQKRQERSEDPASNNVEIEFRSVHSYTYDEKGSIKKKSSVNYQYVAGMPFDSIFTEVVFSYNGKHQLTTALDLSDSSRQVKIYNSFDSLVGDYRINKFGDTTNLAVTVYDGIKVIRKIDRHLTVSIPENLENVERAQLRKYDTIQFMSELIYDKDFHVKTLSYDKSGMIEEETKKYYENGQMIKSISYAFLGKTRRLKETTFYDYSGDVVPDFVSIGSEGDTIAMKNTVTKNDGRIVFNYNRDFDMQSILHYNYDGQLIVVELVDLKAKEKTVSKYTYDVKGNELEEIVYRQSLGSTL